MRFNENLSKNDPARTLEKANYMQFLKIFLKIKFQKLHNSHMGQQIPVKPIYVEAKKLNMPQENWPDFILEELKQPQKYIEYIKAEKRKRGRNMGQNNNDTPGLFTIDEESNNTQM